MIPLEGRLLSGLDEFMLRLGHLKVLCSVATQDRGSWRRILEETASLLAAPVAVDPQMSEQVAYYLYRKRLCPILGESRQEEDPRRFRYPDLLVSSPAPGYPPRLIETTETGPPKLRWQDICLASPGIRSRVGGVNATGKSGSKTPLSHIADWAVLFDLIGSGGEPSYSARLLVNLTPKGAERNPSENPYLIGPERIVLAAACLYGDLDLFVRFAPKLLRLKPPIRKSIARQAFVEAIQEIAAEAESDTRLSSNRRYNLLQQVRELEKAADRGRKEIGQTSTAWHRAASRLETYIDLGLLEKGRQDEDEKYEYIYYATQSLERAVASLDNYGEAQRWLEDHLVSIVYNVDASCVLLSPSETEILLPLIVRALNLPTQVLPIDVVAQGIAWLQFCKGEPIALGAARASVEQFARTRPDIARLSRGIAGDRAEFISVQLKISPP